MGVGSPCSLCRRDPEYRPPLETGCGRAGGSVLSAQRRARDLSCPQLRQDPALSLGGESCRRCFDRCSGRRFPKNSTPLLRVVCRDGELLSFLPENKTGNEGIAHANAGADNHHGPAFSHRAQGAKAPARRPARRWIAASNCNRRLRSDSAGPIGAERYRQALRFDVTFVNA